MNLLRKAEQAVSRHPLAATLLGALLFSALFLAVALAVLRLLNALDLGRQP